MKSIRRVFVSAVLALSCVAVRPAFAIGDEALKAAFPSSDTRDVHDSMAGQKKNLTAIQNDFLSGDADALEHDVSVVARSMTSVSKSIPDTAATDIEMWTLLYKIVTESQAMKVSADKKDFAGTYEHYMTVVGQCVQCHQTPMAAGAPPAAQGTPASQPQPSPQTAPSAEGHPLFGQDSNADTKK